jgi:hypothetical protein
MVEDHIDDPGVLTRVGWFFWRNWNRVVCVTRGHDLSDNFICQRCGLPVPTWKEITKLRDALERIERVSGWSDRDGELAVQIAQEALRHG